MRIKINRLGINGEGIGNLAEDKYAGKVCFVRGALPDEIVDIDIIQDKKKFAIGKLNDVIQKSINRVSPICPYFDICGGCDIQHMNKLLQQKMKRDNIKSSLGKIAGQDIEIDETIRVNDFAYRNKMVFPFVKQGNDNVLGMFVGQSHDVVDIDRCLIANDCLNKFLILSKEYFKKSGYNGYDFVNQAGDIKYVVGRSHGDNLLVTVVATKRLELDNYYSELSKNFENVGLSLIISNSSDEIMSGKYIYLKGIEYLEIEEFGIKYKLDNRGFLQVNNEIKHYLYSKILDIIDKDSVVIDAYSGAGLLSAIVSKKCKSVVGIEINESASNSAKMLAVHNNLTNIRFVTGDVKDKIRDCINEGEKYVVILDPPRAGCDEDILQLLVNINKKAKYSNKSKVCKVQKIIYISCNPATLARDIKVLSDEYNITSVTPLDMFPQTKHVETLVVMKNL